MGFSSFPVAIPPNCLSPSKEHLTRFWPGSHWLTTKLALRLLLGAIFARPPRSKANRRIASERAGWCPLRDRLAATELRRGHRPDRRQAEAHGSSFGIDDGMGFVGQTTSAAVHSAVRRLLFLAARRHWPSSPTDEPRMRRYCRRTPSFLLSQRSIFGLACRAYSSCILGIAKRPPDQEVGRSHICQTKRCPEHSRTRSGRAA